MTTPIARDPIYRRRRFQPETIELCVRWYLTYRLSTAAVTLAGVELAHRIRKRQFSFGRGGPRRVCSLKHLWAHALSCHDTATDQRKVTLNPHCTRTQVPACCPRPRCKPSNR